MKPTYEELQEHCNRLASDNLRISNGLCSVMMHIKNVTDALGIGTEFPMEMELKMKPDKNPIDGNMIIPKIMHL